MALPSKVVDQLSRAPARTPGWSSRVLLFSATFFILSLSIYFGIQYGYKPFLEGQVKNLDKEITDFSKQVSERQQDELVSFYSQLDNMNLLLKRQTMTSKIFTWLEENTNVNVQLTSLTFSATSRTITLGGQARSIVSLGEQLNRFESQEMVQKSQLSQLTLDQKSGSWNFSVALTMRPKFFVSSMVTTSEGASGPIDIPTPVSPSLPLSSSTASSSIGNSSSTASSSPQ